MTDTSRRDDSGRSLTTALRDFYQKYKLTIQIVGAVVITGLGYWWSITDKTALYAGVSVASTDYVLEQVALVNSRSTQDSIYHVQTDSLLMFMIAQQAEIIREQGESKNRDILTLMSLVMQNERFTYEEQEAIFNKVFVTPTMTADELTEVVAERLTRRHN